eukprot:gene8494-318_t
MYIKFIEVLQYYDSKEQIPEYNTFQTKLSSMNARKWDVNQVLLWLGYLFQNNTQFSIYEEIFFQNDINGITLLKMNAEKLQSIGVEKDHSIFIQEEIKKLVQNSVFDTSKYRLKLKFDMFYDKMDSEVEKIFSDKEEEIYSLCNENSILSNYLNIEKEDNEEIDEIKLILSEMIFNKKSLGIVSSLSPIIDSIPKIEKDKIGKFSCGLLIGPWYLEFTSSSLCVPKRVHPSMMKIFKKIPSFCKIESNLKESSKIISKIVTNWNINVSYTNFKPNLKKNQGNSFTFVEETLKLFKVPIKFKGSLFSFMNEIKEHGDAGACFYPTDYIVEFENKFGFSFLPEIKIHSDHDDKMLIMLEEEIDFSESYPHDYLVFISIDLAFWIRSLFDNDISLYPLKDIDDIEISICPCFESEIFEEIRNLTLKEMKNRPIPKLKPFEKSMKVYQSFRRNSSQRKLSTSHDSNGESSLNLFDQTDQNDTSSNNTSFKRRVITSPRKVNDEKNSSAFGNFVFEENKKSSEPKFNSRIKKRKSITENIAQIFVSKSGRRKSITELFGGESTSVVFDKLHEINKKK